MPEFGRLRQEDYKFKVSLGYIAGSRLSQNTNEEQYVFE
jgi:hypothetical protein